MTYSIRSVIEGLAKSHPAIQEVLSEHLEDNDGELLTHVLFGDIVRWVEGGSASPLETDRLFVELDHYYEGGDSEVQNVILASFVEAFGYRSEFLERLGPVLAGTEMATRQRGD